MKKLYSLLIVVVLLISTVSPALAYAHQSHGTHGQGNVNQFFEGVFDPPPWDNPPGLNH